MWPERPRTSCLLVFSALLILLAGCERERGARRAIGGEPAIEATVVTIQTTIQPDNRKFSHSLVIGADLARSGDEVDRWRLFNFKSGRVTFVDDVARTYRHESMTALRAEHERVVSREVPAGAPQIDVQRTSEKRVIHGVEASQLLLRAGSYVRELWFAQHPSIPAGIFPMMIVSAPPASPLSGMMKGADAALVSIGGFPLADRAEIAYADRKLSIERNVVKIERRSVPQSWLTIPSSYRDVTPVPAPKAAQKPGTPQPPARAQQ